MPQQPIQQERDEGIDLFRRAIVGRDAAAWAGIHAQYRPMLIAWARAHSTAPQHGEDHGDIADQALARAWAALTPERFAAFPGLGALLAYLRTCVVAVLIDLARARARRERALQRLGARAPLTPEELVLDQAGRADLWRIVAAAAESEQEQVVLREHFVYGLPPRRILARHPTLFDDVTDVYAAQRNLKARLQRNLELRRLREELDSG
ncbi:MAG TPA: sigma-70 family RNA polymerase sigma factor [Roseiflexaceae bacterium]|nr:sigma-70 family RNA polymerase sigma factor [Roseiflexaceae bacterium]